MSDPSYNELMMENAELQTELKRRSDAHSDLLNWFDRRSVYGELSLEQKDAMTPRELADHCYERKAEQVDALQSQLTQAHESIKAFHTLSNELDTKTALKLALGALVKSKDLLNEVAAYGNCECNIPQGETCVPCECAMHNKVNDTAIEAIKACGVECDK